MFKKMSRYISVDNSSRRPESTQLEEAKVPAFETIMHHSPSRCSGLDDIYGCGKSGCSGSSRASGKTGEARISLDLVHRIFLDIILSKSHSHQVSSTNTFCPARPGSPGCPNPGSPLNPGRPGRPSCPGFPAMPGKPGSPCSNHC